MTNKNPSFVELSNSPKMNRYTHEEKYAHCEEWQKSGLSMNDYCRRSGLSVSTLSKWLSGISDKPNEAASIKPQSHASLVDQHIEIWLASGIRLKLPRTNLAEVIKIVRALESCS